MKSSTILEESEWETVEEESDKSLTNSQESSLKNHDNTKNENIQLFEDLPIPEITREEPIAFESLSESPIITGLKRQSKKLYLEKDIHDDLLPINLPLMEERDHLKEMDEDEIFLCMYPFYRVKFSSIDNRVFIFLIVSLFISVVLFIATHLSYFMPFI